MSDFNTSDSKTNYCCNFYRLTTKDQRWVLKATQGPSIVLAMKIEQQDSSTNSEINDKNKKREHNVHKNGYHDQPFTSPEM